MAFDPEDPFGHDFHTTPEPLFWLAAILTKAKKLAAVACLWMVFNAARKFKKPDPAISFEQAADWSGLTRTGAHKGLAYLEEQKIIRVERDDVDCGKGHSHRYVLNWHTVVRLTVGHDEVKPGKRHVKAGNRTRQTINTVDGLGAANHQHGGWSTINTVDDLKAPNHPHGGWPHQMTLSDEQQQMDGPPSAGGEGGADGRQAAIERLQANGMSPTQARGIVEDQEFGPAVAHRYAEALETGMLGTKLHNPGGRLYKAIKERWNLEMIQARRAKTKATVSTGSAAPVPADPAKKDLQDLQRDLGKEAVDELAIKHHKSEHGKSPQSWEMPGARLKAARAYMAAAVG